MVSANPASANSPSRSPARIAFDKDRRFQADVRRRVDAWFAENGLSKHDAPAMYLKTFVILLAFGVSYALLVFWASTLWQVLPLSVLVGLSAAGIGFNIEHDGGHRSYSSRQWINQITAMTLDIVGASSYIWRWKHAIFHHNWVNIHGYDSDTELGAIGRLHPADRRLFYHRWQHWYMWPLYGVTAIKWHLYDDFRDLITGRIGGQRFPRPRGRHLAGLVGGKIVFFTLAFGLPLLLHPLSDVLLGYALCAAVLGVVLSVVFQLAHCVEGAEFREVGATDPTVERPWAVHQVECTVDFARKSRLAAWLLGGLNFQIEHHLFPGICHVHYPALAPIVEAACRDHGVDYQGSMSFRQALGSHFRWLRRMGRAETVQPGAS
jgi:linoleoyl-CoA desaturase